MEELEGVLIYNLARKVAEQTTTDEHFRAVQAQVQVANQIYFAILRMLEEQNGLAAESLLRTLFDAAVNCIILAKHKEKLNDFLRNGQFTHLRLIRFTQVMKQRFEPIIQATEDDWKVLFPEFKDAEWHKLKTRDSFIEAEYKPEIYDQFFRRASAYAHGEPFITVRRTDATWKSWSIEARPQLWKTLTVGAYGLASNAMLHMLAIISREFKLGIEGELAKPSAMLEAFKAKHIEVMKQVLENQDNQAGQTVQSIDKKA